MFIQSIVVLVQKLTLSTVALAQEAVTPVVAAGTPAAPPPWMQFVPFAVIIAVFYFFIIRPQSKKQKEQQSFISSLKVGDQVVTQSGIFGKVKGLSELTIDLEIAQNTQIKILRHQVITQQSTLTAAAQTK